MLDVKVKSLLVFWILPFRSVDTAYEIPDFTLQADVRDQTSMGFKVLAGRIVVVRVSVRIAVLRLKEQNEVVFLLGIEDGTALGQFQRVAHLLSKFLVPAHCS